MAANIQVQRQPVSIDIDSTGDLAYVANSGSNTISVLDLKARREIATIGAGEEPVEARRHSRRQDGRGSQSRRKLGEPDRSSGARRARLSSKAARRRPMSWFCPTLPRHLSPALAATR